VLKVIDVSGTPVDVAVSSDNVHALTANLFENTISIVDLAARHGARDGGGRDPTGGPCA